jgi:hypothetical protein
MSATPTPLPPQDAIDAVTTQIEYVVGGLVIVMILGFLFVWALLRAAEYPAPSALVVALSLLTFLALAGSIATSSTELVTLAATGIGALAGAVSSQFGDVKRLVRDTDARDRDIETPSQEDQP